MTDRKELIAIFKAEMEEHLTNIDQGIVGLEKHPEDIELLDKLSGELHTIKGSSRVFGYHEIEEIFHKIEDVVSKLQQKRITFNSKIADVIFKAIDITKAILDEIIREERIDIDISEVCEEIDKCLLRSNSKGEEKIKLEKSAKKKIKALSTKKKKREKENEAEVSEDQLEEADEKIVKPDISVEEYIRVPVSRVSKLLNLVGELVINKMNSSQKIKQTKNITKLVKEIQRSVSGVNEILKEKNLNENSEMIKSLDQCNVDIQRLREFSVKHYESISSEIVHLDPTIEELQYNMKEMRMLPCSTVFEGFPRMIRDIAHQEEKSVNLEIYGEDTELDKKVLEGIKDPLMHILRNSIDHGIEIPMHREALDKPKYGTIKLSAFHEAGNVIITVEDDGGGMDLEKIKAVAIKRKLITALDLEEMTEKDVMNLVFMNGFTTSPIITDVSGRGVGLDVVRRDVESLKGKITIDTDKDKGSKVTLILPLTIAIIQVFLIRQGDMLVAFPMSSIAETLTISRNDISTIEGQEAIQHRGHTMPLVRLEKVLGLLPSVYSDKNEKDKEISVIVGISLDKKVGFIVNEIVEEDEVFIKNLGRHLGKVSNISGVTILGTGQVIVVLDVADLINRSNFSHPAVRGKTETSHETKKAKKILVVEDAISTRELEKSILEAEGYSVDTAVDGMDALDRVMRSEYDLVVTDINMPRMDGFEFCETMKKNEKLQEIPVVVVTSLETEDEKRKGIRVGASAYIIKTSFDQTNLLDTIERLIG